MFIGLVKAISLAAGIQRNLDQEHLQTTRQEDMPVKEPQVFEGWSLFYRMGTNFLFSAINVLRTVVESRPRRNETKPLHIFCNKILVKDILCGYFK